VTRPPRTTSWLQVIGLTLLGLISLGLWLAVPPTLSVRGPLLLDYIPLYLALVAPYFAAVSITLRGFKITNYHLLITFTFAILFRLSLLAQPPTLSDDVYRYVWDGYVQSQGINPYQYPVDSPELDPLTTPIRALVNNPNLATPYLPVAQAFFAIAYRLLPDSPLTFQLAAVSLDLLSGLLVALLLKRLGLPAERAIIYLWNPLVIVEFAHGAHVDALMICLMLASLMVTARNEKHFAAPILLALATLVKPVPIFLLPILWERWGWRKVRIYLVTFLFGLLPYAGAGLGLDPAMPGTGVFGSTLIFMRYWNFNGGLYHWLEILTTGVHTDGAAPSDMPGVITAKVICGLALLSLLVWLFWRRHQPKPERWWFVPIAGYLLLMPTVHPWYLTALIALLPFAGNAALVLLYWSASVGLSYFTYINPSLHQEWGWVRPWEYWPLYLAIVLIYIQRRTRALYEVYAAPNLRSK
jgi:alpha-1,6-mannosyltransferase